MRTFIGLCFSVGTTRRIAESMEAQQARLADKGWKLAWVPPANLHLTLKFLGDIAPENIDAIASSLRRRCAQLPAPTLKIGTLGSFPLPQENALPRVLWVGVDGGAALKTLQQAVEGDLAELGFPKETRAYHPHVTVARVIEIPETARAAWPGDVPASFGDERVGELVVYESKLHRAGAEHVALARVPFSQKKEP